MTGLLVSPNYVPETVTNSDRQLATLILGFALGFGSLTCIKAAIATKRAWGRSRRANIYVVMIWGEILVSVLFGLLGWLNLDGVVGPSFWLYVSMCTCWSLQVQFLLQIIINRVSLIMYDQRKVSWIKWSVALIITALNISVYCIWVPARLEINHSYILINEIWDRIEKVIYAICDGGLNMYFLYLVRKTFVKHGMTKYELLFKYNAAAVVCSLSMDVIIIGSMSLKNNFIYVLFHPAAYIVKLNIELTMARLIAKIASTPQRGPLPYIDDLPFSRMTSQYISQPWATPTSSPVDLWSCKMDAAQIECVVEATRPASTPAAAVDVS